MISALSTGRDLAREMVARLGRVGEKRIGEMELLDIGLLDVKGGRREAMNHRGVGVGKMGFSFWFSRI